MSNTTTPESLAFGMILRVLVLRIARLEHGAAYLDGLDEIRESVVEGIGRIHIADAAAVDTLTLRAQAQAVAELLLARN